MSSEPEWETRMISLMSSDGETFEVEAVAVQSETLKHLIEDICIGSTIPLSNVKARVLSKVIEYCKKPVESGNNEKDIQDWDKNFWRAADYLNIKSLLELTCHTVANMIKGKSPKEIREAFNIKNDLTPKEEEIRTENRWAFE